MTTQTIFIETKSVYGKNKAYPACAQSQLFADIAGSKTLTKKTLQSILALNYTIRTGGLAIAVPFDVAEGSWQQLREALDPLRLED